MDEEDDLTINLDNDTLAFVVHTLVEEAAKIVAESPALSSWDDVKEALLARENDLGQALKKELVAKGIAKAG